MKRTALAVCTACCAATAPAQDTGLSVSVGARAWYTQWTTFGYFVENGANVALTQVSADEKFVLMPQLRLQYGDWFASASGFPKTSFGFSDGSRGTRQEYDVSAGYFLLPGLALTLGYKSITQRSTDTDFPYTYKPRGPVIGATVSAPLANAVALYGTFSIARLKTPGSSDPHIVQFDADYRLSEVGLAYALAGSGMPQRWTFTAGYRVQVMSSKDAMPGEDGRDTTQGLTFGLLATF